MTDTQKKTLKLRQKELKGGFAPQEKVLESHPPDVGKTLEHKNAEMLGTQRRRINQPHDEGS